MRSEPSRRSVLAASVVVLSTAVAGCSGGSDDDSTPAPDEGTDSYGIRLFSRAGETHEVHVKVTPTWEDETVFEETVEIEPDDERTWHGVITEEVEHSVVAHLNEGEQNRQRASAFITPGQEDSPEGANVTVRVNEYEREKDDSDAVEMVPIVSVGTPD